jgi:gas vesicle protein
MQKHSNKFMIGAIVGGTVGALTTLLFNTNEGKKIQKKLMKKFHEMNEKASDFGIRKFTKKKTTHPSRKRKSQHK